MRGQEQTGICSKDNEGEERAESQVQVQSSLTQSVPRGKKRPHRVLDRGVARSGACYAVIFQLVIGQGQETRMPLV